MKVNHFFLFIAITVFSACQPESFTSLTPQTYQAHPQKSEGVLIDVRTPEEFAAGHLVEAQNSDWRGGEFTEKLEHLDKSKTYYLYCATGNRSGQAMQKMKEAGFKNVFNLGGYQQLKEAGLKTQK